MHRRTRTRSTLIAAAGLLAAGPLLTACGNQSHPGAAALVGGERIEVSALQGQANAVRAAQAKTPQGEQVISGTGHLTRAELQIMLFQRVVARAADDAGITVSRKEIQQARAAEAEQKGGEARLESDRLGQGHAPGQIEDAIRRDIQLTKLAALNQANLATPEGMQKVGAVLGRASKALKISVNPRFGKWDDQQIALIAQKTPWITQKTKNEEAKQAEQAGAQQVP
ncbi:SurA N-terminal domain-containing protein [Streptomyces sp. NBC_00237]|uniref:SurA N-terminal domain-containing protein n=1 Tax=Streptomyces sp. NBC_00237 TaxID=2975687 RepID=UPI002251C614|nr:SurA N-terminal domain-containing protein [Streptomyces sp. NBC_00237]MCX5200757.1 SurA N-terminal domain-containing protein [Streptomyces sp. NBC_00237]